MICVAILRESCRAQSLICFGSSGCRSCAVPHRKVLGPERNRSFVDMSCLGGDSHIAHSQETFRGLRGHSHDFQGVEFRRLRARQDLLDCPAECFLLVNAKDGRVELTSQAEEGPSRFADFSIQSVPIEILDKSPTRHTGLTFESQGFRQECPLLDQDGARFDCVWHYRLACVYSDAQDRHARSFTVTRLAELS